MFRHKSRTEDVPLKNHMAASRCGHLYSRSSIFVDDITFEQASGLISTSNGRMNIFDISSLETPLYC